MKRAVVLFNLGGPDGPDAVEPFLFNLFNDPNIIQAPGPIRYLIAKLISKRRRETAKEIYSHLGGKSPILEQTTAQAEALEACLGAGWKVFIAMRYWHPRAKETVEAVQAYGLDEVYLLPLYPQYSTTTTLSSLDEWDKEAKERGLNLPTHRICCYPLESGVVGYFVDEIQRALKEHDLSNTRVLFTAHGLPEKIIKAGDPYSRQVVETAAAIKAQLPKELDTLVCYQSRVGPVKWIDPYTDDEIERAGKEGKELIVVPLSFVSEHSETLVELDIEYKELADEQGVKKYTRIFTPQHNPRFIEGLARLLKTPDAYDMNKKYCTVCDTCSNCYRKLFNARLS